MVAPINTVPTSQTTNEDTNLQIAGISVADIDNNVVRAVLQVNNGTITLIATNGLTVMGDGTATVTVDGTQADINNALSALTYRANSNYNGTDTLTVTTTDALAESDSDTVSINVIAINDAPTGTDATVNANEDATISLTASSFGFADAADAPSPNAFAAIRFSALPSGTLTYSGTGSLVGTGIDYDMSNGQTFSYTPTLNLNNTSATPTLTFQVIDDGASTVGNVNIDQTVRTLTFNLAPVNDAPTATNLSAPETYTEEAARNLTDIVVTDVDSASVTATLTLSNTAAGTLNTATSGLVTSTFANGVWTASGATADVNALLAGATFTPTSNFNGGFTIATSVTDGFNAAITGTKVFTGIPVNDAPVLSAPTNATVTFNEDSVTPTALFAGTTLADVDNPANYAGGSLTIATTGDGGINLRTGSNFSVVNPALGVFTLNTGGVAIGDISGIGTTSVTVSNLNGNATFARVQDLVDDFTYTNASNNPTAGNRTVTLTVNDGGNVGGGALSNAQTQTLNVVASNDAPTTANRTVTGSEDDALTITAANFTFVDGDDNALTGITITALPTLGHLRLNGADITTTGGFITKAQLDANSLTYLGAQDGSGSNYASFGFTVRDGGGGLGVGSALNSTAATMTINLTADNSGYSVAAASAIEGDTAGNTITFTVTRTGDTTNADVLSIAYVDGVAVAGTDYTLGSGTVTIAAGSNSANFTVNTRPDYEIEGNETFTVNLTRVVGNTNPLVASAIGTINNDDVAGTITVTPRGVTEADTTTTSLIFDIARTGGTGDAVFTLATTQMGSTATSSTDFAATTAEYAYVSNVLYQVTNPLGVRTLTALNTFTVPVIGDYLAEPSETVAIAISGATTGLGSTLTAGTITDNDVANTVSIADVSVTEGDTASSPVVVTLTRTGGGNNAPFTVNWATTSAGLPGGVPAATPSVDYGANAGTVTFAPGQLTAQIQTSIIGDTLSEGNERFRIVLSNPTNGVLIGNGSAFVTIIDNDPVVAPVPGAQVGTGGDDILIAQTPGAVLAGGDGNDTYLVHNMGDVVIEGVGAGVDILYTDVSYNLGENQVEAMSVAQQTSTADINLIGNYVSQTIVGNYGNNILNGGSGADTLIGLFGNDTYAVGDSRIVIQEQAGQGSDILVTSVDYVLGAGVSIETFVVQDRASTAAVNLTGNEIAQTIVGSEGANVIDGGAGSDTLIGFGGADTFAFTTALGASNVDTIVDFTAGSDRIALGSSIFAAIGTTLDASEFVTGTAATTASQFIVYNAATGALFYDADGSGAGAAVQFAAIAPNTALTAAMFTVV